ncbi:unnamed protein product, partial [Ixodes persulcatus]
LSVAASILYTAVIRGKVALPCDITPPSADDAVALVLWYKDEGPAPIYTLDARRGHVDQARQSAVSELGARAYFNMMNRPAFLQLDPVEEEDAGEYRCRVDFRKARSVNTVINLKVIVPPGEPVILDEDGKQLQGLVGPFNEGDPLQLTCQVDVGKTSPVSACWSAFRALRVCMYTRKKHLIQMLLPVRPRTRRGSQESVTCRSLGTNVILLGTRSADENRDSVRRVNRRYDVQPADTGSSNGSRTGRSQASQAAKPIHYEEAGCTSPPRARNAERKNEWTGDSCISTATASIHSYQRMIARACWQTALRDSISSESLGYKSGNAPIVTLQLGSNLRDGEIQEGRDVYLDCKIVANPYTSDVGWLFEGRELASNATAGVIVSTQSLVLQRVRRAQRGRYACSATNKEGRGVSKDLYLRVKYAPVCKTGQKWVYGVSKQESVSVRCDLDADPSEASFHWVFNSSLTGKRTDVVQGVSSSGSRSVVSYLPKTDDDYGTLLCWGTNSVGIQRDPCAFAIVPAGLPDSVINCSQINATESGMSLECVEGPWDGGMSSPVFVAEVYDLESGSLKSNLSSLPGTPAFVVRGLPGGASFRVLVYATNGKGRSAPFILMAHTLRPAEKFTAGVQGMIVIRPVLGVLIGVVIALVIAAIVVIIFIRCKKHGRSKGN